jgi:hypothetical protein
LPNFQGIPERPVWSGQFQKANVAWQSFRDIRWRRKLTDGRNVWYRENRAAVVQRGVSHECLVWGNQFPTRLKRPCHCNDGVNFHDQNL